MIDVDKKGCAMFDGLFQPTHLLLILLICMVLFGGKKLPELGKGLGEAIRGFKSAMRDGDTPENDRSIPPSTGPSKPAS
jgi:sec-independent protein translocase protein TatA